MISLIFFLSTLIVGLAMLKLARIILPLYARLSLGLTAGSVFCTAGIFLNAWVTKLTAQSIIFFQVPLFLLAIFYLRPDFNLRDLQEELHFKVGKYSFIVFGLILTIICFIFIKSIYTNEDSIIAGNRLVWTDWPIHFAIISSFVQSNNIFPQNPQYAGQILTYPFFSDFLSAVLQVLGENIKNSLVIPGIVLSIAFITNLYYFGNLITRSKRISVAGIFVGIFSGGIGFVYFFNDLISSSDKLKTLLQPPHEYTFYQEKGLWFFSFLYSELLPQRSFLFGLPLFFLVLIFLIIGLIKEEKRILVLAGIALGIMPFFHMHAFISIIMFNLIFLPLTFATTLKHEGVSGLKRQIMDVVFFFIIPAAVIALPQILLLFSLNLNEVIAWHTGWMNQNENIFWFWFKNTGLFLPLLVYGLLKNKLSPLEFNVAISALFLFIVCNLFQFAMWPYDNLKIMTFWYLICAFIVAKVLAKIYKNSVVGKVMVIVLIFSLTASGLIDISKIIHGNDTKIQIWSKNDIEISRALITNTLPNQTVLAAAQHDNPASALAGRPVIIGYPGNAWSWGLKDWSQREADVHALFKGDSYLAPLLIEKYKVRYVLISQRERNFEPEVNEKYFSQIGTLVAAGSNYRIYKLK